MKKGVKIFLGADHAGFSVKEKIKKYFDKKEFLYEDLGAFSDKDKDDYPDFAFEVGEKVSKEKDSLGILICGTGTGMCIAVNKVKGIRAVSAYDSYGAKMSKEHNDTNVLCLRGREFSFSKILYIIKVWLNAKFSGEERHKRRIKKIENYEK